MKSEASFIIVKTVHSANSSTIITRNKSFLLLRNPKHVFFRVFPYHSQLLHPLSTLTEKYRRYCRNQVCFSAKSLKKPMSTKQNWSQPGQVKLWEGADERRSTACSGAACMALRQQVLKSSFHRSILSSGNQGIFSIQTIHGLLYFEYCYIAGGLDISSSEMGSRRGSGAALTPCPNLGDTS